MKQTAVEWLGNEITNRIVKRNPHDTIIIQTQGEILIELIEQAKAMEKEQIIQARATAPILSFSFDHQDYIEEAEQYYEQKFKSE